MCVLLLEDMLAEIVGADNVGTYSFRFHRIVYKNLQLKRHTKIEDGETVITNRTAFLESLKKRMSRTHSTRLSKIGQGVANM